jgi:hypothetical protein
LGGKGAINERPGDSHGQEIPSQPQRSPASGRTTLDVTPGVGGIVEETQLARSLERYFDRRPRVTLPQEPASKVAACVRAQLQAAKYGAIGRLDVGCLPQALLKLGIDESADSQPLGAHELPGNRPEPGTIDFQTYGTGAARVGIERRDC